MSNLNQFQSGIKSIQRGTLALDATSKTVTITAVVVANSTIIINAGTAATSPIIPCMGYLTNTTTVTFTVSVANEITVAWQVIEFQDQYFGATIKSIQRGTLTLDSATTDKTDSISAVVRAKSFLRYSETVPVQNQRYMALGVLTNTTTLTFSTALNQSIVDPNFTVVSWEVVEFY